MRGLRGSQKPTVTFVRVRAKFLNLPPFLRGCDKCQKGFELGSIVLRIGFKRADPGIRGKLGTRGNLVSFWRHVPCYVDAKDRPIYRDPNRLRRAKPQLAARQRSPRGLPMFKPDRTLLDRLFLLYSK